MQTFLPYADFRTSLETLDTKRLGKQRVEAMQLVQALERSSGGWLNHPATKMWRGHIPALKLYHDTAIRVWKERGYKNTMIEYNEECYEFPEWLGDPTFHASHRSNLLRKDPVHYGQFNWTEPHDLPYVWPLPKT
jgi:hypothetical protein